MGFASAFIPLLLLLSLENVQGTPYLGFPFDDQLPEIARIGEDYTFSINSQTFKSDASSTITYKAFELPSWLEFDSSSLVLSGLPSDEEKTGKIDFILQGTDEQSSLNQTCSIYLSDQPSPEINSNDTVYSQLSSMGNTNGNGGIVLDPQEAFSLSFKDDTFEIPSSSNNKVLKYYGKSANRTSLPSWCFFDESTLTFSGTTPPVNSVDAPSLEFDLTLIATDYEGYSAVYSNFRIIVGGHHLYFENSSDYNNTIMTDPGETFSIDLPLDRVYLDDEVITTDQIGSVVNYNGPSWVSIKNNSRLTGTVPDDQTSNTIVNVTLFDIYGDSVFMDFDINVLHEIFNADSIANQTVTDGTFYQYTLPKSLFKNETATKLDVTFDADWLTFYYSNNTFVGQVPKDFKSSKITIDASMNSMKQTLSFFLVGKPLRSSSSRYSSSTKHSSSSKYSSRTSLSHSKSSSISISKSHSVTSSKAYSSSTTNSASNSISATSSTSSTSSPGVMIPVGKSSNSHKTVAIAVGVAIPVAAIIAGVLIFYCCCLAGRRKNKQNDDEKGGDEGGDLPVGGLAMQKQNTSNSTLAMDASSARVLAEKNLTNLDKDYSDGSSYYSVAQSTLTSASNHNLYGAANQHVSTDYLLGSGSYSAKDVSGVFNSWRRSSNGNLKTRDSLSSLATVATNDLLTVNVVNDDRVRKSQMILPELSKLRNLNKSSDSMFDDDNRKTRSKEFNSNLEILRETEHDAISRDRSYDTISSEAQLVEFENGGSLSRAIQRKEKSYHGELYNADDSAEDEEEYGENGSISGK